MKVKIITPDGEYEMDDIKFIPKVGEFIIYGIGLLEVMVVIHDYDLRIVTLNCRVK